MGGVEVTDTTRQHAQEMLRMAENLKNQCKIIFLHWFFFILFYLIGVNPHPSIVSFDLCRCLGYKRRR